MIINRSFKDFKFRHRDKKNQIIYTSKKVKNDTEVINLLNNKKKIKLKDKPNQLIEKIIEDFKFETPKNLPKICSLISGYFSYDSIRYIEKIPNKCKDDLKLPDVRL